MGRAGRDGGHPDRHGKCPGGPDIDSGAPGRAREAETTTDAPPKSRGKHLGRSEMPILRRKAATLLYCRRACISQSSLPPIVSAGTAKKASDTM